MLNHSKLLYLQHEEPPKFPNDTSNGSSTLGEVPKEEDANLDFPLSKTATALDGDLSVKTQTPVISSKNSGLFLYVDIHGHASKRGIFM